MKKIPIQEVGTDDINVYHLDKKEKYALEYRKHHSNYHPTGDEWPWDIIKRILKKYHGKPFDDAFSEYCQIVPKYQQHLFLEEFNDVIHYRWRLYYVDDNGLIQKRDKLWKKPKTVIIKSADYKFEYRHKVTNRKKPIWYRDYPFNHQNYKSKFPKAKNYYEALSMYDSEFIPVTISGWTREFESKNDPEYKRLWNEVRKEERKLIKERKKEMKLKALNALQVIDIDITQTKKNENNGNQ